eukprot:TRINITY_DN2061_c0_g1_i2.p1 TRINITY_DN2061_c0_g1~~TRINITY_DN2061_c0_g1_i2.p1  ORF type:complete len:295 (+),score=-5.43 TRINITY_DN2061_c0_g1_i2:634-1518(+)
MKTHYRISIFTAQCESRISRSLINPKQRQNSIKYTYTPQQNFLFYKMSRKSSLQKFSTKSFHEVICAYTNQNQYKLQKTTTTYKKTWQNIKETSYCQFLYIQYVKQIFSSNYMVYCSIEELIFQAINSQYAKTDLASIIKYKQKIVHTFLILKQTDSLKNTQVTYYFSRDLSKKQPTLFEKQLIVASRSTLYIPKGEFFAAPQEFIKEKKKILTFLGARSCNKGLRHYNMRRYIVWTVLYCIKNWQNPIKSQRHATLFKQNEQLSEKTHKRLKRTISYSNTTHPKSKFFEVKKT